MALRWPPASYAIRSFASAPPQAAGMWPAAGWANPPSLVGIPSIIDPHRQKRPKMTVTPLFQRGSPTKKAKNVGERTGMWPAAGWANPYFIGFFFAFGFGSAGIVALISSVR
jgi:hypothetical protein